MQKQIILNQFFGLGDLLFIEPIFRHFHERGFQVFCPVEDHYYWLIYYIKYVHFRKKSEFPMDYEQCRMDYEYNGTQVLPLRFSTPILRGCEPHEGSLKEHFMLDKYRIIGLPLYEWCTLKWTRNEEKENRLYDMLNLKKPYTFANMNFGGGFQSYDFGVKADVYLRPIEGFTLLDWAKVIIEADVIHTVETSLVYMVETLPIKAREIHMWPRMPHEGTFTGVKNFISDRWFLHEIL
jgi:hypothetical protein